MKALVTLSSESFVPGTLCLMHSVARYNSLPDTDRVLLIEKGCPSRERLTHLFNKVIEIDPNEYAGIERPEWNTRFRKAFYKLEVLRMRSYDRIVFIDSDVLCRGDISPLFSEQWDRYAISASADIGMKERKIAPDTMRPVFNTGVMVLNNSKLPDDAFNTCLSMAKAGRSYDGSDQGVINLFMAERHIEFGELPMAFNTLKRVLGNGARWSKVVNDIRLLHYVGKKPWQSFGEQRWKVNEKGYELIEQWWHEAFAGLRNEA